MSDAPTPPLRDLWRELESPPMHRPLADEDAATQASVAWLAAAWRATQPAATPAQPRARRTTRLLPWIGLAAAAASFALILLRPGASPDLAPPAPDSPPLLAAAPRAPQIEILSSTPERLELRSGAVRLTWLQPASASAPLPTRPQ